MGCFGCSCRLIRVHLILQKLYRVFVNNATLLAQIYTHRVRDWHSEAVELRGYATPISVRNEILSIGGSAAPATMLEEAGLDMASPAFWQSGFDALDDLIRELERMEAG